MAIKYQPTRITTNFALCGLILLIISTCKARLSSDEIKSRVSRHMLILRQFPCKVPQPRSISVQDLLGNQIATSEIVQPHMTVLHRCDVGTGCCPYGLVCAVESEEEVDLHFFITDHIQNLSEFREFKVRNHTVCFCKSMKNTIK